MPILRVVDQDARIDVLDDHVTRVEHELGGEVLQFTHRGAEWLILWRPRNPGGLQKRPAAARERRA